MERRGFIKKVLKQMSSAYVDRIAMCIRDGENDRDVTYRDFCQDILKAAGWFRENNIVGQNIAMISEGDYWFYVALFGCFASGNAVAMIAPELAVDMLEKHCDKTDITAAYVSNAVYNDIKDKVAVGTWILPEMLAQGTAISVDEVHEAEEDETVVLLFTSGTTGISKAAMTTSFGLQNTVEFLDSYYEETGLQPAFHVIPRYHDVGMRLALVTFKRGEILNVGRSVQYLMMNLATFNPAYAVMVPSMASSLVRLLKKAKDQAAREKIVGKNLKRVCLLGAAITPALAQDLEDLGIELEVTYGMTETSHISWSVVGGAKKGSVGKVRPGVQVRIQDGEIQINSPSAMKGYYKQPEETEKVIGTGWMATGDMGYVDEDGYCYLTGRKKNVIILSNGKNVSPEEIEAKLDVSDAVMECMVWGDGKGICAEIYTQDPEAVEEFVRVYNSQVPRYRQVYKVNCTAEPLEKTGTGKIKRKENVYV